MTCQGSTHHPQKAAKARKTLPLHSSQFGLHQSSEVPICCTTARHRKTQPEKEMEPAAAAGESRDPPPPPSENPSPVEAFSSSAAVTDAPGTQAREVAAAMEAVERDATAIAESYASLFASLRVALSNVTSTSVENMECLGDVVGRLQESALEASSKGNKYINSCLRLNEEMRGLESLAMQLYPFVSLLVKS
ncbi:hypothetical protein U9M48_015216 [Paspalum notatum var. saurae]|uniref:BLOC-1-related complex subunit 6 C-terminal helix domain-containing protein n=1 Tax=Paspalum notatum var. saurae TaxID=547442 RepID=A0AAQ3T4D8_PASNO